MLEKSSSGPGVSLAASIVKCGKAHTGQLKTVSSGLSSSTRRASLVASAFVYTSPLARTTSCPDSSSSEAIRSSMPRTMQKGLDVSPTVATMHTWEGTNPR